MVFGSGLIVKDPLRKRRTSDTNAICEQPNRLLGIPRRNVTFADIEELYERYGEPSLDIDGKTPFFGIVFNIKHVHVGESFGDRLS